MKTLKVLVLYGGQNANTPRDALLNWLNSDNLHDNIGFKIDARKVADMPPNAGNSVDDRVTQAMTWADKGIMLVTPDDRTAGFGAPNTLEEIGRWRGLKGGETLSIVYKKGMEIPSNLSGLVYSSFKEDIIADCSIKLARFLADPIQASASKSSEPQPSQSNSGTTFNIGSVGGDLVSGDKVGGNVNKAERDVNVTNNHYYGQGKETSSSKEKKDLNSENVRLDVAHPEKELVDKAFSISVGVRHPGSNLLTVPGYKTTSSAGHIIRHTSSSTVEYTIKLFMTNSEIIPQVQKVRLFPDQDSQTLQFMIIAKQVGIQNLLVNAYQDEDVLAANTLIQIQIEVKVEEPNHENDDKSIAQNLLLLAKIPIRDLRQFLNKYTVDEIDNLFIDLEIDSDNFGSTKGSKIRGLLTHLDNRDQLGQLIEFVKEDSRFKTHFKDKIWVCFK